MPLGLHEQEYGRSMVTDVLGTLAYWSQQNVQHLVCVAQMWSMVAVALAIGQRRGGGSHGRRQGGRRWLAEARSRTPGDLTLGCRWVWESMERTKTSVVSAPTSVVLLQLR